MINDAHSKIINKIFLQLFIFPFFCNNTKNQQLQDLKDRTNIIIWKANKYNPDKLLINMKKIIGKTMQFYFNTIRCSSLSQ